MAMLFHGTTADHLGAIRREGLVEPADSPGRGVFLSTSPVSGKGGDPVAFSYGWPEKEFRNPQHLPGHIVVVDLPPGELHRVREVVSNTGFDLAYKVRLLRRLLAGTARSLSEWCTLYWLARSLADAGVALEPREVEAAMDLHVHQRAESLRPDLTPAQWQAFMDAFRLLVEVRNRDLSPAAFERERTKLLAAHGIRLPDWIETDSDSRTCAHCVGSAFSYGRSLVSLDGYRPFAEFAARLAERRAVAADEFAAPLLLPASGPYRDLDDDLAFLLRVVRAHTDGYGADLVERFFVEREAAAPAWTWDDWYAAFPAQAPGLPRVWTAEYARPAPVTMDALRAPDSQVHADRIPPELILGTIQVTDGRRIVPSLRPDRRRGQTLQSMLLRRAHTMRR
ncbi:hypothetical protein CLV63_102380 [Murinocardiopsis flavida]|uniref:Uncharacterized protein n=1 Tax=Murinocardiopsis flavida TaxID=645275 RepID=A0A2P8DSQ6_9ACTN|nr:hypothetical protein [Murinocardiopsis flavida]PSL00253.1 hypothetical protein CLV63_102380 [Murinocardiopsis flavida]